MGRTRIYWVYRSVDIERRSSLGHSVQKVSENKWVSILHTRTKSACISPSFQTLPSCGTMVPSTSSPFLPLKPENNPAKLHAVPSCVLLSGLAFSSGAEGEGSAGDRGEPLIYLNALFALSQRCNARSFDHIIDRSSVSVPKPSIRSCVQSKTESKYD
jgi:hypothetical protein